ncbi:MAG: DVUA0089 family protein [Rhodospirillales bacterium]
MSRWFTSLAAVVLAVGLGGGGASAASFSFSGTFANDDDVRLFDLTVGDLSTVTLRTSSYAGGTQADGTVVAAGGFDPMIAVFDATGLLLAQIDDGPAGSVPVDPVSSGAFDALLTLQLAAGAYTVAVMQYDNAAKGPNLSDGFAQAGLPFFTAKYLCAAGQFCDPLGFNRSNAFALDVAVEKQTPIPLPGALPLLLSGLAGLGVLGWRRRRSN